MFIKLLGFSIEELIEKIKIGSIIKLNSSGCYKTHYLVLAKPYRWNCIKNNVIAFRIFALPFKTFGLLTIMENSFINYELLI